MIDKSYGHASYGCGSCCGYANVLLDPSPFGGPPEIDNEDFIYATQQCSNTKYDFTGSGYNWASSNTAVATLPNRTLHTVAVGTLHAPLHTAILESGQDRPIRKPFG